MTITSKEYFSDFRAKDYGTLAYSRRILQTNLGKTKVPPPSDMLTLVHFRDPVDRESIEAVDPADAQKTLGAGVNVVRVTLELTDAPVTPGVINQLLPWLCALIGKDPMHREPIYHPQKPKIGQENIFYTGFTRDY